MKMDKNRDIKLNIGPILGTADALTGMNIETLGDARNFFVGVNNLASQISLGGNLILNESGQGLTIGQKALKLSDSFNVENLAFADSIKLSNGITNIVGYGQAVQESGLFGTLNHNSGIWGGTTVSPRLGDTNIHNWVATTTPGFKLSQEITSPFVFTPQHVNTQLILNEIPRIKSSIIEIKEEAKNDFKKLEKLLNKKIEEQDSEITHLKEVINDLKEEVALVRDTVKNSVEEEIVIGPLVYKNLSIYYNESILNLSPQEVRLCRVLMEASYKVSTFVSDDVIQESITTGSFVSTGNMQRVVSKLRKCLENQNKSIEIIRIHNNGYILELNKIR